MQETAMNQASFIKTIYDYYLLHKRSFPWRDVDNPYYVLVSEIMLQQTQTYRVEPKFAGFIAQFPTLESLASAPLSAVLAAWQGLGYNRRAKFLHQAACQIVAQHEGSVPCDPAVLQQLPGIGAATAASISAFAYNTPTVFIETNIRAVYIHFFFPDRSDVHDRELLPLIEQTLDCVSPRQWYYALMDYGVMLKKTQVNPSRKSKHHTKQSRFVGSTRQVRGAVLRALLTHHHLPLPALQAAVRDDIKRLVSIDALQSIVDTLVQEEILQCQELSWQGELCWTVSKT